MPFLHWRNITFPMYCVLRVTHCLKTFAWSSFFSRNFPWDCDSREAPTITRQASKHPNACSITFSLLERSSEPRSIWKSLDPVGSHPECEPEYRTKFTFFSQLALKWFGIATAWISIQYLFSYSWQWQIWSTHVISEASSPLATSIWWSLSCEMSHNVGSTTWHPALSDTLWQPVSSLAEIVWKHMPWLGMLGHLGKTGGLTSYNLDSS